MSIPKIIWTTWLSEKEGYPPLIEKCIKSQNIFGYEQRIITLDNCRKNDYIKGCLKNHNWAKASDYLRMAVLYRNGGIYVDADMEVLPNKNFDQFLTDRFFTSKECAGLFANSALGCEPGHPILKEYMKLIDDNFKGTGDMTFEPGIRLFHDLLWRTNLEANGIKIYPTEYFFPLNHLNGQINITPDTVVFHHYLNSWLTKEMDEILHAKRSL
jgi:hypothetical protein